MAPKQDAALAAAIAKRKQEEKDKICEPKPLPYHFEKELVEKQNKHKRLYTQFGPSRKIHPVATKFHARHQQTPLELGNYDFYYDLGEYRQGRRRMECGCPVLESQVYGWLPHGKTVDDLQDMNYVYAPKRRCDMTKHEERICSERQTERPAFNGLRFIV